jgi:AICAR transformylase/IMP cyclohydrolase PurH
VIQARRGPPRLVAPVAEEDSVVAADAAQLFTIGGPSLTADAAQRHWRTAVAPVRDGFQTYLAAVRDGERARLDAGTP